jgi:hypothetical protein
MRKGASMIVKVIISLVVVAIFLLIAVPILMGFVGVVAPAGEAEKTSFEMLVRLIAEARDSSVGVSGISCVQTEDDNFYLSEDYYITTDSAYPTNIQLMKKEQIIKEVKIERMEEHYLCCEDKLSLGSFCTTKCGDGAMIIGKDEDVYGSVCVCKNYHGDIKVWKSSTEIACWSYPW